MSGRATVATTAHGTTRPDASRQKRWDIAALLIGVIAAAYGLTVLLAGSPAAGLVWSGALSEPAGFVSWILAASTDAQFHLAVAGGGFLIAGAVFAHFLWKRGSRWAGFAVACGTGRLPAVLVASLSSLALGSVLWGWTLQGGSTWQPLFVAFVSVPAVIVLTFGSGARSVVTAVFAGAVLTTSIAVVVHNAICVPLQLPGVVSATTAMWTSAIITFVAVEKTGWLTRSPVGAPSADVFPKQGMGWTVRRALADFTEPQFFGNEWAGAGLIGGFVLTGVVVSAQTGVEAGIWVHVLGAQVATALLANVIWRRQWRQHGWYPTFVPLVSLVPALVLRYNGTLVIDAVAVILGAVIMPPVAFWLGKRTPFGVHPFAGYVMAMTICCTIIIPLTRLIVPAPS